MKHPDVFSEPPIAAALPAKEGGERSERALASVALAEEGGCSLVFDPFLDLNTKEQPPHAFGISPPSQEGSL